MDDRAGRAFTSVVNAAADVVADVAETVGHGIADGLTRAGDTAGRVAGGTGAAARAVLGWVGGVVAASFDLAGAIVKGVVDLVGGVIGAVISLAIGAVSRDRRVLSAGGRALVLSIGGPILVVGGKLIELVQALLAVTPRRLRDDERDTLWRVYRRSVALYNVRIVEGWCGIFQLNRRPFTLGNTIYMKNRRDRETLVHECGHVWQNQHEGPRYALDAVLAQLTIKPRPHAAYRWTQEPVRGRERWVDFNKEAQAEFLSDLFGEDESFYDDDPVAAAKTFRWADIDLAEFARTTVAIVRSRRSRRLSVRFNPTAEAEPAG